MAGLQGIIDHILVGHLMGYTANAAIGVSWQIFLVVIVFVSSLFAGMGVMVARFAGAGEPEKVNRVVYQAFLTAVILSCFVLAPIGYFFAPQLLDVVNAAAEVKAEALPYLRIMFVFSFGMLIFFMLGGALRAAGDAQTPLRLGIAMTVLNLIFNIILIRGLGPIPAFGTAGAAMGTVIAAGIAALAGLYLLFSKRLVVQFSKTMSWRPDWEIIRSLFRFGLPTGFQGIAMNLAGVLLLRYLSLSGLFITVALVYTGGLQGSGDTRSPLYITLVSQIVIPLGMCGVLQSTRGLQPADIGLAIVIGHATRCVLSTLRFRRGKWRAIKVEIGSATP